MHPFWAHAIEPLLDSVGAREIVEIGAERGMTTRLLLARAARVGGTVHAIDPAPQIDVRRAELEHGDRLVFHRRRSEDVLGRLSGLDAALIDGDHNWHTVNAELSLLARRADADSAPMPLVIAHDVGWPYGRRDMYYDPHSLPDSARHDAARGGLLPGRDELGSPGINAGYWNATREGGPRNGVLTALEDFAAECEGGVKLITVPGWHGLGVLATRGRLAASTDLEPAIRRLESPEYLRVQIERIEAARIVTGILARASAPAGPSATELATRDYGLLDEPT